MKTLHFSPPKRRSLIIQLAIISGLSILSITGFYFLTRTALGISFLASLLVAIFAFIPVPFFIYRAYSLQRAEYMIDRNSLSIRWGLRMENIPLTNIEWMRPAADLSRPIRIPALSFLGEMTGLRRHPDLGLVEFLASGPDELILVATPGRVFAISPENPAGLLQAFARATELGSLAPAEARSIYPSFIVGHTWSYGWVRFLWLSGLMLNLGLFVWVSLLISAVDEIAMGINSIQSTPVTVPSTQLILLPAASLLLFVLGWLTGLYLFRWERERPLAFTVWSSGTLMSVLFLIGVLFIITSPV